MVDMAFYRFVIFFLALAVFFSPSLRADERPDGAGTEQAAPSVAPILDSLHLDFSGVDFPKGENRAFRVGEHLVFEVVYGVIHAGTGTLSIPDTQWVHGRPCYHIVTTAKSHKFFDSFYKVRDRIESFMDIEGMFSWRFEKHIREGKYKRDRFAAYDFPNSRIITKRDTIAVDKQIQDIMSAFYLVRTLPLEVGKHLVVESFSDRNVHPVRVLIHAKDRVNVPAGTFDCIVVEPVLQEAGVFNQKGRIAVWVTDDERRMPVLMKSKVLVGSIEARLKSIEVRYGEDEERE